MAKTKRRIKEKEIIEYLKAEGLKEIKVTEKHTKWYKKASKQPSCLRTILKEKIKV